jgi:hypothetical protein
MTTLDALHTAAVARLGTRADIVDYYADNVDLLLQYYERDDSDREDLLHSWRMRNEKNYSRTATVDLSRCKSCRTKIDTACGSCQRCGVMPTGLQIEYTELPVTQSAQAYKRSSFFVKCLAKLKLELPIEAETELVALFAKVETAFLSKKCGRRNMLPYSFVIQRLLTRLGYDEYAKKVDHKLSWESQTTFDTQLDDILLRTTP